MSDSDDFMNSVSAFNFEDPSIFHDRVILVEDKKFHVQSGLLSMWSDYFKTMFNSEFKEKNEREIELKDVSADEFEVFLKVIYPGRIDIQVSQVESLIGLAYRFLSPNVLKVCKQFIEKEFATIDKIMLFRVSDKYHIKDWKEKALTYIKKNMESLDLIQLLKLAFEQNSDELKKLLRFFIYTAKGEQKCCNCNECLNRIQRINCTHIEQLKNPITQNSLVANYIDEILLLSGEIQSFVLSAMVKYQ